jgi:hypothetical protein
MASVASTAGRQHGYPIHMKWTGNTGTGTREYRGYERAHEYSVPGKPIIPGSSDPAFRGDKTRYNPEELLVMSISSCHMLWFLYQGQFPDAGADRGAVPRAICSARGSCQGARRFRPCRACESEGRQGLLLHVRPGRRSDPQSARGDQFAVRLHHRGKTRDQRRHAQPEASRDAKAQGGLTLVFCRRGGAEQGPRTSVWANREAALMFPIVQQNAEDLLDDVELLNDSH